MAKKASVYERLGMRFVWINSSHHTKLMDLPPSLLSFWRSEAPKEFRDIPRGCLFYAKACEGLMQFFSYCVSSKQSCALPSKAADSIWHAWAKMDPKGLRSFCMKHFKRDIPHIEAENLPDSLHSALAQCWVKACEAEKINPAEGKIPSLFSLDYRLKMPEGYGYIRHRTGLVCLSPLNREGTPTLPDSKLLSGLHPALTSTSLLAGGFITLSLYNEMAALKAKSQSDSGSGGSSCGSSTPSSSCSDSSSCDSSSCGSSCGGGCGD